MSNLLLTRHPDIREIGTSQANKILKYTSLDENGNVLECLQRESVDKDFVDVTEIAQEQAKIAKFEKELSRMQRNMNEERNEETLSTTC